MLVEVVKDESWMVKGSKKIEVWLTGKMKKTPLGLCLNDKEHKEARSGLAVTGNEEMDRYSEGTVIRHSRYFLPWAMTMVLYCDILLISGK